MQFVTDSDKSSPATGVPVAKASAASQSFSYPECRTIRRNGAVVGFAQRNILLAMPGAFMTIEVKRGAASVHIANYMRASSTIWPSHPRDARKRQPRASFIPVGPMAGGGGHA